VFRRRKDKKKSYQIPAIDELEQWVPALISSFNLTEGKFTFLPAYGGVILFIKDQGISWLPYEEIKEILGKIDKAKLADSGSLVGGIAVATAAHPLLIPFLAVRYGLKGAYRTLAKPPPLVSVSILKSLIESVNINREQTVATKLLGTFEKTPYKEVNEDEFTYKLTVQRKFFSKFYSKKSSFKYVKGIKNFFSRSIDLEFTIPAQADVKVFAEILNSDNINVNLDLDENISNSNENQ
jgi:hypothetical protein